MGVTGCECSVQIDSKQKTKDLPVYTIKQVGNLQYEENSEFKVELCIVEIDGIEYYATKHGQFGVELGPKVERATENE